MIDGDSDDGKNHHQRNNLWRWWWWWRQEPVPLSFVDQAHLVLTTRICELLSHLGHVSRLNNWLLNHLFDYRPSSWRTPCNPHRSTPHNVFRLPWQNNIILVIRMSHSQQNVIFKLAKKGEKSKITNILNLTGPRKCCTCVWRLQVIWIQQDCRWHQH